VFYKILPLNLLVIAGVLSGPSFSHGGGKTWEIKKTQWSASDEKAYEDFIFNLGEAIESRRCRTVESCMASSANIYYKTDPDVAYHSDCADWPYFLRAYFSWKNELPFSYVSEVGPRNSPDGNPPETKDIRYSNYGNLVVGRRDVLMPRDPANGGINAIAIVNSRILDETSSANFRVNYRGMDEDRNFSDFYPVKLNRQGIRPGTMIYDPNGHVAVVYKITNDGQIFYMDAHPKSEGGGYPLSYGIFGVKFSRSRPGMGAGFKKWRPLQLVNAVQDNQGNLRGGRIVGAKDSTLSDYGTEQFYGNVPDKEGSWSKGVFKFEGSAVSYYEFIRRQLAIGGLKLDPVHEIKMIVADLCSSVDDRAFAVESTLKNGTQHKPHPLRLPMNIFGTEGEWENEATPSRDARIKTSFKNLLDQSKALVQRFTNKDPSLIYSGSNLRQDMLDAYLAEAKNCVISYTNSAGNKVTLNLEQIRKRIFDISFDPYHCPELRWGAKGEELATCRDGENKRQWYAAEKWLRNQIDRTYDARMDYSLGELTGPKPGVGVAVPPDVDVVRFLQGE